MSDQPFPRYCLGSQGWPSGSDGSEGYCAYCAQTFVLTDSGRLPTHAREARS